MFGPGAGCADVRVSWADRLPAEPPGAAGGLAGTAVTGTPLIPASETARWRAARDAAPVAADTPGGGGTGSWNAAPAAWTGARGMAARTAGSGGAEAGTVEGPAAVGRAGPSVTGIGSRWTGTTGPAPPEGAGG